MLIDHLRGDAAARRALATALDEGERLWTRNIELFPMFPDLTPPY